MRRLAALLVLLCLARPLLAGAATESPSFLPAPENVTIQSYNFDNVLKWSPVTGINGSVTYRVEEKYNLTIKWEKKVWKKVNCTDITKPECHFKPEKYYSSVVLRVRAEQGELKSAWIETKPFQEGRDTILGPPRAISVSPEGTMIHISFLPPFEYAEKHVDFEYLIEYWEKSTRKILTDLSKNRGKTFKNLKERTEYCFQVTASLLYLNPTHQKSGISCTKTTIADATRILRVILILGFAVFILIVIFVCIMLIQKYRSEIKALWKPPLTIPSHFEEDLQNLQMTMVEEFKNCAGEDHWDNVLEISEEQRQIVTNNFTNQNQELMVEEHRRQDD